MSWGESWQSGQWSGVSGLTRCFQRFSLVEKPDLSWERAPLAGLSNLCSRLLILGGCLPKTLLGL